MSTRSRIAIANKDGSITSVYCHLDGYPEGVGAKLQEFYNDPVKVRELISRGDISALGEYYDPELSKAKWTKGYDPKTSDEEREQIRKSTCYYNDRGEDTKPRTDESIMDFIDKIGKCGEDFTYLYDEDYDGVYRWKVCESPCFKIFGKDLDEDKRYY